MRVPVSLFCLALAACAGGGTGERPDEGPAIVSVNPCSDRLLEALGADDQIMAVSHWSHEAENASASPEWARRFSATTGRVEELVQSRPDLVLSGGPMPPQAKAMLADVGIEARDFPVPATVDESLTQITDMGAAIGREEAARMVTADIEAALAKSARHGGQDKRALVFTNGALTGEGTLIADMLTRMGYRNVAAHYGVVNLDNLRLERLLADPPDVIFAPPGSTLFDHPALARLEDRVEFRPFAKRLSWCAGPTMVAMARAMEAPR